MSVESVLLKNTSLTEEQLNSVLGLTFDGGSSLKDLLEKKDSPTADELVAELCSRMGLQYIKEIPVSEIPVDLIQNIPINFAKKHEV
ncbi:MAG: type II secretion system protein GspE, partial [Bdellovibrionota bacterium]